MTALYGLLPPIMCWSLRAERDYRLRLLQGGSYALSSLIAVGVAMGGLQVATDFSAATGGSGLQVGSMPLFEVASADAGSFLSSVLMVLPF